MPGHAESDTCQPPQIPIRQTPGSRCDKTAEEVQHGNVRHSEQTLARRVRRSKGIQEARRERSIPHPQTMPERNLEAELRDSGPVRRGGHRGVKRP